MIQRKCCVFLVGLWLALAGPAAATEPVQARALEAAQATATRMQEAVKKHDWETLVGLTHARVVELMGGKKKMLAFLRERGAEMKLVAASVGKPTQAIRGPRGGLQVLLPMTVRFAVPDGEAEIDSQLLGVSGDDGRTWTYVDVKEPAQLRQLLPDLAPELRLQERGKPRFHKR